MFSKLESFSPPLKELLEYLFQNENPSCFFKSSDHDDQAKKERDFLKTLYFAKEVRNKFVKFLLFRGSNFFLMHKFPPWMSGGEGSIKILFVEGAAILFGYIICQCHGIY